MRLLVAETDSALADFLQSRLQQEGFSVELISDSRQFSRFPENTLFDLALLDTNLTAQPGSDPLQSVLHLWPQTSVILLSSEAAVEERIRGLNAGADDFLVKPFHIGELVARVRAVLRRRSRAVPEVFVLEDLEVNRVSHEVRRAGRSIELTAREYALLEYLLRSPNHAVSRNHIVEEVWHMHRDSITNVVDVYINYLRRKIDAGAAHPLIRTVRGVGYQIGENHAAEANCSK
jgi:two-component system, OmpR family, response regulator